MLAIVIPYYKINFFEETLKSLSVQTDKRFNVYIGNDASQENPENIINEFYNDFNYEYVKFDNNLGGKSLVLQWNRCLEMCSNERWVMILGDDDVLENNVVEEFYKSITKIEKLNINVIRYATIKINSKSKKITNAYTHPNLEKSKDFFFRETRSSLSEYIFKKDCIDSIGFKNLPLAWYSDVLGVLEFSDFNMVYSINSAIVNVRISEHSISGKKDNQLAKNKAKALFYYYLTSKKLEFFNKDQQIKLLHQFSKSYINDKKNIFLFLKVTKVFLINLFFIEYANFLFKLVKVSYNQTFKLS